VALARDLGLSRSATQDRLARLKTTGAIAGFTVVEGAGARVRQLAYLMVKLEPGRRCAQLMHAFRALPAIVAAHSAAGPVDILMTVEYDDVAILEQTHQAVAAVNGVAEVSTHIVLERHIG
jgi:DNA-binding Lrp family transcriptional regulator